LPLSFLIFKNRKEFPSIGGVDFIRQRRMKSGVVFLFAVVVSNFQKPKGIPLHWKGGFHPPKADEIWGGVPFFRFVGQTPVSLRLTPPLERGLSARFS
jgi:hypothetical protein